MVLHVGGQPDDNVVEEEVLEFNLDEEELHDGVKFLAMA
jgi:hypothetical protein